MITTAVQKGSYVYAYSGTRQLFSVYGELHGFTATTVSVRKGDYIYVYNERGSQVSSHYCKK